MDPTPVFGRRRRLVWNCLGINLVLLMGTSSCAHAGDSTPVPATPAVKLSSGGICHDAKSQFFPRLKEYQAFSSMQECIAAGGRPRQVAARKSDSPTDTVSSKPPGGASWFDRVGSELGVSSIGWLLLFVLLGVVIAIPVVRSWNRRRHNRKTQAAFEDAETRRWRGHRLDPPPNPDEKRRD